MNLQLANAWALPAREPESTQSITTTSTLYLGEDPYTQSLLRLQYDWYDKTLEWQLLNNGHVLSSQSHALPGSILSADIATVYKGDQIAVVGRAENDWFLQLLNSQGDFLWERRGEGRMYDLAFSDNGQQLYGAGEAGHGPMFVVFSTVDGELELHNGSESPWAAYKQLVVTGGKAVVVAQLYDDGQLNYIKWRAETDPRTGENSWSTVPGFCPGCARTGIKAVALTSAPDQEHFYGITSGGGQLEFSVKDVDTGKSVMTQTIPVESGSGAWEGILRIDDVSKPANVPGRYHETPPNVLIEEDSRLHIFSSGCQLLLASLAFGNMLQSINACGDYTGMGVGRRLLEDTSTDPVSTEGSSSSSAFDRFLLAIEITAGVVGIITSVTVCTGLGTYLYKRWKNRQHRIEDARDTEISRRTEESKRINKPYSLYLSDDYKPRYHFDLSESSITFESTGLHAGIDSEQVKYESNPLSLLLHSIKNGSINKVEKILEAYPEFSQVTDSETGHSLLHTLADLPEKDFLPAHISIANLLFKSGANSESKASSGLTALELAALLGKLELFELMLTWKQFFTFEEATALFHIALAHGDNAILSALVRRGLHKIEGIRFTPKDMRWPREIDARSVQNEEGYTLLHEAVLLGNHAAIKFLLDKEIVPGDAVDEHGRSALHLAVVNKRLNTVKELLGSSAMKPHVNQKDSDGNTPLHLAAGLADNLEMIKLLRDKSASLRVQNKKDRTPLDLACEYDNHEYIELLTTGSWLPPNLHKHTLPFMARNGFAASIRQLDKRYFSGIDKPVDGEVPLEAALKAGQFGSAFELMKKGASTVNYKQFITKGNHLPLLFLKSGYSEAIKWLLNEQWEINGLEVDSDGNTVFHIAASIGYYELFNLLPAKQFVEALNIPNDSGDTIAHIAIQHGQGPMLTLVIKNGGSPNVQNKAGNTPLHLAALKADTSSLSRLVKDSTIPLEFDLQNNQGQTALDIAREKEFTVFANELIRLSLIGSMEQLSVGLARSSKQFSDTGNESPYLEARQNAEQTQAEIHPQPPAETTQSPRAPAMPRRSRPVSLALIQEPEPEVTINHIPGSEPSSSMASIPRLVELLHASLQPPESPVSSPEDGSMSEVQPSSPDYSSETHASVSGSGSWRQLPTAARELRSVSVGPQSSVSAAQLTTPGSQSVPDLSEESIRTHRPLTQDVTHSFFIPEPMEAENMVAPAPEEAAPEPQHMAIPMDQAGEVEEQALAEEQPEETSGL